MLWAEKTCANLGNTTKLSFFVPVPTTLTIGLRDVAERFEVVAISPSTSASSRARAPPDRALPLRLLEIAGGAR